MMSLQSNQHSKTDCLTTVGYWWLKCRGDCRWICSCVCEGSIRHNTVVTVVVAVVISMINTVSSGIRTHMTVTVTTLIVVISMRHVRRVIRVILLMLLLLLLHVEQRWAVSEIRVRTPRWITAIVWSLILHLLIHHWSTVGHHVRCALWGVIVGSSGGNPIRVRTRVL